MVNYHGYMIVSMPPTTDEPLVIGGTGALLIENEWLTRRVAELEAENAELRLKNDALFERVVQLEA